MNVTVLDVPGPPTGPVTFENITKDGLKMFWHPPDYDGGSEIIGYTVEKCRNRQQIWKPVTASAKNCEHEVQYLKEGIQYNFRICALNVYGSSQPLITDRPVLIRDQFDAPGAPRGIAAKSNDLGCLDVTWKPPELDGGSPILGYVVEKKEKGSFKWTRCNRHPVKDQKFTLNDLLPESVYQLRVMAVNSAGESEPCVMEDGIKPQPSLGLVKPPKSVTVSDVTDSSVTLTWDRPVMSERMKLMGFVVEKKRKGDEDWTQVSRPSKVCLLEKIHFLSFLEKSFFFLLNGCAVNSWLTFWNNFVFFLQLWTSIRRVCFLIFVAPANQPIYCNYFRVCFSTPIYFLLSFVSLFQFFSKR